MFCMMEFFQSQALIFHSLSKFYCCVFFSNPMGLSYSFKHLCILASLIRILFLIYGEYQDAYFTVKYTDIDYVVFTDAARYMTQGQSPYLRETYRYTPLLAMLLTPNIYVFPAFGKCLFAAADILVGYLIHQMLLMRGMSSKLALRYDALWLLNPFVCNISTRGNAESLLGVMVLGTLYLILHKKYFYSGCFVFGFSVHFKIYPVIYAVPLLMLLDDHYGDPFEHTPFLRKWQLVRYRWIQVLEGKGDAFGWLRHIIVFVSPVRIVFGVLSAFVFFVLTGMMYQR